MDFENTNPFSTDQLSLLELNDAPLDYSGIIDHISDGLVIVNEDYHIEKVNIGLQKLLGFGSEELIGRPIKTILPDAKDYNQLDEEIPIEAIHKDESKLPVLFVISLLRQSGKVKLSYLVKDNRSEQRLNENTK